MSVMAVEYGGDRSIPDGRNVNRVGKTLDPALDQVEGDGLVGKAGLMFVVGFVVVGFIVVSVKGLVVATPGKELPTISSPSPPNLLRTAGRGDVDITGGGGFVNTEAGLEGGGGGGGGVVCKESTFTVGPDPGMVLKCSLAR